VNQLQHKKILLRKELINYKMKTEKYSKKKQNWKRKTEDYKKRMLAYEKILSH